MRTHLYCLLPAASRDALPEATSGIDGAPVRSLVFGEIVAWVSDVAYRSSTPISSVRAHDAVIAAALSTGSTPLPARFGQRFPDDEACRSALGKRYPALATAVDAIQGFVEMTLLLTLAAPREEDLQPLPPAGAELGTGRRYLEMLRAREDTARKFSENLDHLSDGLVAAVRGFIRQSSVQDGVKRPFRTISHLIEREDVAAYTEAARAAQMPAECRMLVIGPRAPYTFTTSADLVHDLRQVDRHE